LIYKFINIQDSSYGITSDKGTTMGYYVQALSLTKKYGKLRAVNNLNLKIHAGEIYGLLGPNGAGKTTAIKMICGLLTPTSGQVCVFGEKATDSSLAGLIGYMPQETALYYGLTVHQNIAFFGEIYGFNAEEIRNRESELLKFIDLENKRDELVVNLSGGMKHRVSLACALFHEPKLLVLDEPTVGVDPELRVSFWDYFNELKENGTTILITTHYMDEARRCDRIGFIRQGTLIAEGIPAELLKYTDTDSLEDAFLTFARLEGTN
jgi:ABC-2 type transport system ATP-binding protein